VKHHIYRSTGMARSMKKDAVPAITLMERKSSITFLE
jgi:hypothetical protein